MRYAEPMKPGIIMAGRFLLERQAGSGGMGAVFRAQDRLDGATVALKILHSRQPLDVERFEREAGILADFAHPGIVRYVGHGLTPEGEHWLAMEWLEGEDLGERLLRAPVNGADSIALMQRTAEVLAFAHAKGLVHRDIKPSNLFLVGKQVERIKLLDFGIARPSSETRRLTQTGVLLGTPGYIAPELVQGPPSHDPRTDLFSLGCVLFECLTGVPAFEGTHPMAVLAKLLLQEAPRVRQHRPDVPEALDDLVARLMAKDPEKRPSGAGEVAEELARFHDLGGWSKAPRRSVPPTGAAATEKVLYDASAPLSAPSPSEEEPAPTSLTMSEKRLVSVVLAGDPDADESGPGPRLPVVELRKAVAGLGGQVNVLAGDSLIVTLWGPGSAVDRADRAAQCALILRANLPGVPICIASGRGRVSARIVEGDVIDRGVRTLRTTRPGPIHLDDVTAGMLTGRLNLEQDRGHYFLRSDSAELDSPPLLLGKATPCVGRTRELATLEGVFAGCVAERVASPVLVIGPAGAGKSRLGREFVDKVRQGGAGALVLSGRAPSLGTGSPFGMIADAIRKTSGIQDSDALDLRRRKLRSRLAAHLDGAALHHTAVFLGELLGAPFPDQDDPALRAARDNPQLMGDAMRDAWEDWLTAECAATPVLLVLEDLQWGDAATVRLIDSTLRNLRDLPLMVLVLSRPEVATQFPGLWAEREVQTIKLGPLSKRAAEQLVVDALGPGAKPEAIARIIERADGNPFYLEELIRAVAGGRDDLFPDSVLGTVEARLDAEGNEAKRVLRAASVFGDRFSKAGVAALLGGERHAEEAGEWLKTLASRELVGPASTTLGATDPQYAFRHAIVREAAYATLTEQDRGLGHRLAGEWLERTGSRDAATLAEHFQRGAEPKRAIRWYVRAAEQALEANDLAAVIEQARRGVACGAIGAELGELHLIEAEAHMWRGEPVLAEQRGLEAAALLEAGSSTWFRALRQAVLAAGRLGAFDRVAEHVAPARAHGAAPGGRGAQIACLAECAIQLLFGGRTAETDAVFLGLDGLIGDPSALAPQIAATVALFRGIRAAYAGDLAACLEGFEASLAAFEAAGDRRNACAVRNNLGVAFAELGDYVGAEEALRAAHAVADRMGLQDVGMIALQNLGHALFHQHQLPEARRVELRAAEEFRKLGDPRMEGVSRVYLSKIAFQSGDLDEAEREARAAAAALEVAPPLRAVALATLARALIGRDSFLEATAVAEEAHAILESLGGIEEGESLVRLVHAEALAASGDVPAFTLAIATARARLLERAAKIGDRAWRDRFLKGVPDNVRTLELARSIPPPPP
jgi:serine/threonine protein kinase/tetratricopeptide (TPR) repeat protein